MDFFNTIFENADAKDAINAIVDIISEYDVFDIISRTAGLNLLSENQNKGKLITTDTI